MVDVVDDAIKRSAELVGYQGHHVFLLLVLRAEHLGVVNRALGDLLLLADPAQEFHLEQIAPEILLEQHDEAEEGEGHQGRQLKRPAAAHWNRIRQNDDPEQHHDGDGHQQVGERVQIPGMAIGIADGIRKDPHRRIEYREPVAAWTVLDRRAVELGNAPMSALPINGARKDGDDIDPEDDRPVDIGVAQRWPLAGHHVGQVGRDLEQKIADRELGKGVDHGALRPPGTSGRRGA